MFYIRILKPRNNRLCKIFQILLRKCQGGNHFVINGLLDKFQDILVLHGLKYDIVSAKERGKHKRSMGTV